jgi:hypothetical protein
MYTHLLPDLATERRREIRRDATAASLVRLVRQTRSGHRHSRAASAQYLKSRLLPRTVRP